MVCGVVCGLQWFQSRDDGRSHRHQQGDVYARGGGGGGDHLEYGRAASSRKGSAPERRWVLMVEAADQQWLCGGRGVVGNGGSGGRIRRALMLGLFMVMVVTTAAR